MRNVVFLTDARSDLADISEYITRESGHPTIGLEYVTKLVEHCYHIAELPGTLGTPRPELQPDLRSIVHDGYLILFRYVDDRLEVVTVVHARRDLTHLFGD